MAYGLTSTTCLLALGIPPAAASASVHTAEIFTSAASGLAHLKFGNVERRLVIRLAIPGVLGGALGAYVVVSAPLQWIRPAVSTYLLVLGVLVVVRAFRRPPAVTPVRSDGPLVPLGFVGGLCDAIGGGGWGPVVTSTLVARGNHPRTAIGSANAAEFFVTLAESASFFMLLGFDHGRLVLGLVLGGVVAAPVAAYVCRRVSPRPLMAAVGIVVILLSLRGLFLALR